MVVGCVPRACLTLVTDGCVLAELRLSGWLVINRWQAQMECADGAGGGQATILRQCESVDKKGFLDQGFALKVLVLVFGVRIAYSIIRGVSNSCIVNFVLWSLSQCYDHSITYFITKSLVTP